MRFVLPGSWSGVDQAVTYVGCAFDTLNLAKPRFAFRVQNSPVPVDDLLEFIGQWRVCGNACDHVGVLPGLSLQEGLAVVVLRPFSGFSHHLLRVVPFL